MRIARTRSLTVVLALVVAVLPAAISPAPATAVPNPVATTDAEYLAYGRVFPDPQGCTQGAPGTSPWAKGNVCVGQFLNYNEAIAGAEFLQRKHERFVQVIRLDEAYDNPNFKSAGIPTAFGPDEDGDPQVLDRDRQPLYLFKITDAQSDIPEEDRLHFAYGLSIHGIERAGLEGGIRAMEDLVTWAACEADAGAAPACASEGPFPKRIVETPTEREVPTAGDVLRRSVIYLMLANPDGWHRGDIGEGFASYQRYNGNGVDMNRDWPTVGYTYRPYSPASEPEVQAFSEVLTGIRKTTSEDRFAGGIDLHGQLTAVAFSFTLLGSGQRDFRKNFSTVDQSLRAWEDQTARLAWSPYIANGPNNPGPDHPGLFSVADQWGSVVDTIGYQITGGLGDWFESPIGLGAVGIDNEMSLSHLAPDTIYEPGLEQAHIDGNKGLIYSQLASMLTEQDSDYVYNPQGKVGYIFDPRRISHAGADRAQNPGFPAQNTIDAPLPCEGSLCEGGEFVMDGSAPTLEFDVKGPDERIWNGGITVEATFTNVQGIAPTASLNNIELQRFETVHGEEEWETVVTSYIQGGQPDLYAQAGQVVTANDPTPGRWRVKVTDFSGGPVRLEIDFSPVTAERDPGQAPFDVSNMDFFDDLNRYIADPAEHFQPVTVDEVLADPTVLDQFDSVVVANDFMPGFVSSEDVVFTGDPQEPIDFSFGPASSPTPAVGPDGTFEFDVLGAPEADNDEMVVTAEWLVRSDYDVYVEQLVGTQWINQGCECSFLTTGEQVSVTFPQPGRWRVRLDNFAAAPQPVEGTIDFKSEPAPPAPPESEFTAEQFQAYSAALAAFAEGGGNLVLTDRSLDGLVAMGLVPQGAIGFSQPGGRGPVPRYQFDIPDRGNLCTPKETDPLVKDVCLPGTAGGTRRQAVEPTPIGYSPDATEDGAAKAKLTQFFVNREDWQQGCGESDPNLCTSGLFGEETGLGERHLGDGVVRIAGAMFPDPLFAPGGPRDMRFGLASYALTFSGWQIFLNLVDYQRVTGPVCTIVGTDGRDLLQGTAEADVICGLGGKDDIRSRGGDDLVFAGDGNDSVMAGHGNDTVHGEAGDDVLMGGTGDDSLFGGPGFDRLNGQAGTDACAVEEDGGTATGCE